MISQADSSERCQEVQKKKRFISLIIHRTATRKSKKEVCDEDVSGFVPDDEMLLWRAVHALKVWDCGHHRGGFTADDS